MYSERQHQRDRGIDREPAQPNASTSPWSGLHLSVPNDRSNASIVTFVECVLVELTHEHVGAEYSSSNVWGEEKTQYIAADTADETFRKRHFDERLGWHEQMLSRGEVRDNLINRLTRAVSLASNRSHTAPVDEPDTFRVKPLRQLRTDSQTGSC